MYCNKCGTKIEDENSLFCNHCGNKLKVIEDVIQEEKKEVREVNKIEEIDKTKNEEKNIFLKNEIQNEVVHKVDNTQNIEKSNPEESSNIQKGNKEFEQISNKKIKKKNKLLRKFIAFCIFIAIIVVSLYMYAATRPLNQILGAINKTKNIKSGHLEVNYEEAKIEADFQCKLKDREVSLIAGFSYPSYIENDYKIAIYQENAYMIEDEEVTDVEEIANELNQIFDKYEEYSNKDLKETVVKLVNDYFKKYNDIFNIDKTEQCINRMIKKLNSINYLKSTFNSFEKTKENGETVYTLQFTQKEMYNFLYDILKPGLTSKGEEELKEEIESCKDSLEFITVIVTIKGGYLTELKIKGEEEIGMSLDRINKSLLDMKKLKEYAQSAK